MHGLGEVGAVDIRDEAKGDVPHAVVPERLIGHDGTEIRSANADVDDVPDAASGVAGPGAAPDARGELGHAIQHRVNVGHDVVTVHDDGLSTGRAKRHMQHRPLLGDVDAIAAEHGIDPRTQAGFVRQTQQQLDRFRRDAILRIVEV